MLTQTVFSTDDRYLAAWLVAHGVQSIGTGSSGRYVTFLFPLSPEVEVLQHRFYSNAPIPVKDFIIALELIWDIIRKKGKESSG